MEKTLSILRYILLFAFVFQVSSCKKVEDLKDADDELTDYEIEINKVKDLIITDSELNFAYIDILSSCNKAGIFADQTKDDLSKINAETSPILGGVMAILFYANNSKSAIIADWGDDNNLVNGIERKGGFTAFSEGYWRNQYSEITIDFGISESRADYFDDIDARSNFYINDNSINGDFTISNLGDNNFFLKVENGTIVNRKNEQTHRDVELSFELIEGYDTPLDVYDNVWSIYGTVVATNSNSVNYSVLFAKENPIVLSYDCEFPNSGIAYFSIGVDEYSIDYGYFEEEEVDANSVCDYTAKFLYDNEEEIIYLNEEDVEE